jgi:heat shock protein HslJ
MGLLYLYLYQITAAVFERITLMTQEKEFLRLLGKIMSVYLETEFLLSGSHI